MNTKTHAEHLASLERHTKEVTRLTNLAREAVVKAANKDGMQPLAIAQRMNLPLGQVRNILGLF